MSEDKPSAGASVAAPSKAARWRARAIAAVRPALALVLLAMALYGAGTLAFAALAGLSEPAGPAARHACARLAGQGPEMLIVPGGVFEMGAPPGEAGRFPNEGPVRTVAVPPFAIGRCEVTFDEYDAFTDATGRARAEDSGWGRGRRPVVNVSWADARAYAAWLSAETGRRYRLPTEAEWEYSARAGTATRFWWGDEVGVGNANCRDCGSEWDGRQSAPVGSFEANAFGLHDTSGNVWEWVEDCWQDSYEGAPVDGSPWGEAGGRDCVRRVLRGGSWDDSAQGVRSAARDGLGTGGRFLDVGFRLAQDL